MATENRGFLSQNQLKGIAAAAMVADHLGVQIFSQYLAFRMVGRLAFPLFAYFVYEGARYTRRPGGYLGRMLAMGMVCLAGYGIFAGEFYGNILITFSLSLLILFSLELARKEGGKAALSWRPMACTAALVAAVACLCKWVTIDYGFWGVVLPVFAWAGAALAPDKEEEGIFSLAGFALGLVILCWQTGWIQWYSLAALPLLAFYSGKRGKWRMKHFFYWFYPIHLVVIYLLSLLIG